MASPSPPHEEDAVCCMCGDHGLPRELFSCESCRVRQQHSYCSDLYPRATAYRRCNWCLREPQAGGGEAAGYAAAYGSRNKPAAETKKRKAAATTTDSDEQHRQEGCSSSSRRPPAELGYYPVKKKRKAGEQIRAPTDTAVKGRGCNKNAGESNEELMRARKAARVTVKVRRYKLLAEVISC